MSTNSDYNDMVALAVRWMDQY